MNETLAWSLIATGVIGAWAWLWIGDARGEVKRLAFRVSMLLLAAGVLYAGRRAGIFALVSPGFAVLLGCIVLLVVVGNLFGVRFCDACGRMHRNLRDSVCRRCGLGLSQHGLTTRRKRPPLDPTDPLGKKRSTLRH
ncbi:MAG: hypothetical protein JST92_10065 [Deltaproteobacteria bacterium]|nr:hypothetical protein [Deltaproteobacteria bacterium]